MDAGGKNGICVPTGLLPAWRDGLVPATIDRLV
jgi:hypothetical protein